MPEATAETAVELGAVVEQSSAGSSYRDEPLKLASSRRSNPSGALQWRRHDDE